MARADKQGQRPFPALTPEFRLSSSNVLAFPIQQLTYSDLTPQQLAHDFLAFARDRLGLHYVYWQDQWWKWQRVCYKKITEVEFVSHLSVFLEQWLPQRVKGRKVALTRKLSGDVLAVIRAHVTQPDGREAPFSLLTKDTAYGHHVTMQNGVLDVEAVLRGEEEGFRALSPSWFSTNALPFYYNPDAVCPKFEAFLGQIFEGDQERIDFVQEWIGWCCVYDYSYQQALIMTGDGANGKGVLSRVIEMLLGEDNVSHVALENFGKRFQLGPTVGKLLNMAPEIAAIDKAAEEQLKAVTGGDRIAIDVKFASALDVRMTARCMFSTNSIPSFFDRTGGLRRRLIILPFNYVVPETQRILNFERNFVPELPGIFNFAIAGLKRLRERGKFKVPSVSETAVERHMLESNPAAVFLAEQTEGRKDVGVSSQGLYQAYTDWFAAEGYHRSLKLSHPAFAKEVRRVYGVDSKLIRCMGTRAHYYPGVSCEGVEMITI